MAGSSRKNPLFTNPFFAALLVVSTLFVLTILIYLVAAYGWPSERPDQGTNAPAFAAWMDRKAPLILGVEFLVMLATGILAMSTDDWFSGRSSPGPPSR